MSPQQLAGSLNMAMEAYTTEQCASFYDEILTFSDSSYDDNMRELGYVDLDDPSTINIYAASFEDKGAIEQAITDYNETVDELEQINYIDYVGWMTYIINAITYVRIAFVAVSLIVSSIMIGVITRISVQERTKENWNITCHWRLQAECLLFISCRNTDYRVDIGAAWRVAHLFAVYSC